MNISQSKLRSEKFDDDDDGDNNNNNNLINDIVGGPDSIVSKGRITSE
jgi:hypothetical protein